MNHVPLMFGQQAMANSTELFERHFTTKSYNPDIFYPRIDQFQRHFERYNAVVHEVAEEQGIPCADPYSVLKNRPELFADVVHLHAEGARLVGREFARALTESGTFAALVNEKRKAAVQLPAPSSAERSNLAAHPVR
jgi:hypothetical protein